VLRTRVGYSGGLKPSPDYHDLKDHCETTQIQFNPSKVSYTQLLRIFWERHDYATPIENQYKSAIFYNDEQQRIEAEASLELVKAGKMGQERFNHLDILTVIAPATTFFIGELYHQKYFLQCNRKIFSLLKYRCREDMIDDPVATSINGYLHGSGCVGAFMAEVDSWPLPFAAKLTVINHVAGDNGLDNFMPLDESHVVNPLPGPFELFDEACLDDLPTPSRAPTRKTTRTYSEVVADFSVQFPTSTAKC
jgi:peptide methionine sulfoxide reductase MsrA